MTENFTITREWLNENKTINGGYTSNQLEQIGIEWGTRKNEWYNKVIGKEITLIQKEQFEKKVYKNKTKNNNQDLIIYELKNIIKTQKEIIEYQKYLIEKISS